MSVTDRHPDRRDRGALDQLVAGAREHDDPGPAANGRLTALAGVALLIVLAAEGLTIVGIHRLLAAHVFIGFIVVGVVAVKLASTSYRFFRYYTGDPRFGQAGPPRPLLRVLAPLLIVLTLVVLGSGIGLLATHPGRSSTLVTIHKASFILWFVVTTVHVLAYALRSLVWSAAEVTGRGSAAVLAGRRRRFLALLGGLVVGLGLAVATAGWAHPWIVWFSNRAGH